MRCRVCCRVYDRECFIYTDLRRRPVVPQSPGAGQARTRKPPATRSTLASTHEHSLAIACEMMIFESMEIKGLMNESLIGFIGNVKRCNICMREGECYWYVRECTRGVLKKSWGVNLPVINCASIATQVFAVANDCPGPPDGNPP